MKVFEGENGGLVKAWVEGVELEEAALKQISNTAQMPFIFKHLAVMPDAHWGMGSTVGTVIPTEGAIIPAAVGVDIGCGMMALRTSLTAADLPDNLFGLRTGIEKRIPHGRTNDGKRGDRGAWGTPTDRVVNAFVNPTDTQASLQDRLKLLVETSPGLKLNAENAIFQLATLGGGNHFVEICLDKADRVWIMLHSGSRGIGARIGLTFINQAKEDMRKWFINLPDADLAYLPQGTDHFNAYMKALGWAQAYARTNRELMMEAALEALYEAVPKGFTTDEHAVNCHHNYVSQETHFGKDIFVTRKGAVSAKKGELGIIPGSMGARSFIVEGLGNKESFCSCSHGAGRKMSRAEAVRRFTLEDHAAATAGIECRKDSDVIDETPMAYKDIDAVMAAQPDLVKIKHELRQVICVKG